MQMRARADPQLAWRNLELSLHFLVFTVPRSLLLPEAFYAQDCIPSFPHPHVESRSHVLLLCKA